MRKLLITIGIYVDIPSTVLHSLNPLQECEMVYSSFTEKGVIFYSMYDVLFQHWAESI
jgi:hypothetical protein